MLDDGGELQRKNLWIASQESVTTSLGGNLANWPSPVPLPSGLSILVAFILCELCSIERIKLWDDIQDQWQLFT